MLLNSTSPLWEMKFSMSFSFVIAVKFNAEDANTEAEADASSSSLFRGWASREAGHGSINPNDDFKSKGERCDLLEVDLL